MKSMILRHGVLPVSKDRGFAEVLLPETNSCSEATNQGHQKQLPIAAAHIGLGSLGVHVEELVLLAGHDQGVEGVWSRLGILCMLSLLQDQLALLAFGIVAGDGLRRCSSHLGARVGNRHKSICGVCGHRCRSSSTDLLSELGGICGHRCRSSSIDLLRELVDLQPLLQVVADSIEQFCGVRLTERRCCITLLVELLVVACILIIKLLVGGFGARQDGPPVLLEPGIEVLGDLCSALVHGDPALEKHGVLVGLIKKPFCLMLCDGGADCVRQQQRTATVFEVESAGAQHPIPDRRGALPSAFNSAKMLFDDFLPECMRVAAGASRL